MTCMCYFAGHFSALEIPGWTLLIGIGSCLEFYVVKTESLIGMATHKHITLDAFFSFNTAFQCMARSADLELDLDKGRIIGRTPHIKLLNSPQTGRTVPCSAQAVMRLDFKYLKRVSFELYYGDEPKLWTFLLSDSPKTYGFGGNHYYSSNCASVQVFNKQMRIYSNVLSNYRTQSIDGHSLMKVQDHIVGKNSSLTIHVRDEFIKWDTKGNKKTNSFIEDADGKRGEKRGRFLFTLSGQKTEFGPNEYYLYAAFNRVPPGRFHNGSGLCRVRIKFRTKRGKNAALYLIGLTPNGFIGSNVYFYNKPIIVDYN